MDALALSELCENAIPCCAILKKFTIFCKLMCTRTDRNGVG